MSGQDASVAQYGPPTPTPTACVGCGPPTQGPPLPYTGFDAVLWAPLFVLVIVAGLALRRLTLPGRRRR